ncbi:MAG TPA: hypothetical protein VF113_11105 [Stellaceae bacterium]
MLLSGCGSTGPTETPAIKAAGEEMRSIRAQCEARRQSGELTGMTAVERCAEPDIVAAYAKADYPYMDLIRFAEAARLAGAEKVDKGEISERDYDRQRRELRDRLAGEIDRRNAETPPPRSNADMPDPSTTAKLVAGLSAFSALER